MNFLETIAYREPGAGKIGIPLFSPFSWPRSSAGMSRGNVKLEDPSKGFNMILLVSLIDLPEAAFYLGRHG